MNADEDAAIEAGKVANRKVAAMCADLFDALKGAGLPEFVAADITVEFARWSFSDEPEG